MWKRDDAVKPAPSGGGPAATGTGQNTQTNINTSPAAEPARSDSARGMEKGPVNIGKSVIIKGELTGSEDLTIEGHVEGKIELRQNVLTIGPNGRIKAQVFAKSVVILGEVTGNVTASEKVDLRDNGSVDGDIAAPRVAIAEGAHFRGSIDMQRAGVKSGEGAKADTLRQSIAVGVRYDEAAQNEKEIHEQPGIAHQGLPIEKAMHFQMMGGDQQRADATPTVECPKAQGIAPCEGSHYDVIGRRKAMTHYRNALCGSQRKSRADDAHRPALIFRSRSTIRSIPSTPSRRERRPSSKP